MELNLILAGDDPVATDVIAAKIIGFEYPHYEVGPIARAHSQGLGIGDPSEIEVLGAKMDDVRKRFLRASCEIVTPHFENVTLFEGAACRTRKAWIKFTLYMFKDTGFFEDLKKMDKQFFFVGLEPPLPTDLDEIKEMTEKGLVIIFGDCAVVLNFLCNFMNSALISILSFAFLPQGLSSLLKSNSYHAITSTT